MFTAVAMFPSDAVLFTLLVDFQDKNPHLVSKTYEQLYRDVRQSVDLCHRDGVIKEIVMKNPSKSCYP
jgi:5'-nucleotidase